MSAAVSFVMQREAGYTSDQQQHPISRQYQSFVPNCLFYMLISKASLSSLPPSAPIAQKPSQGIKCCQRGNIFPLKDVKMMF